MTPTVTTSQYGSAKIPNISSQNTVLINVLCGAYVVDVTFIGNDYWVIVKDTGGNLVANTNILLYVTYLLPSQTHIMHAAVTAGNGDVGIGDEVR